MRALYQHRLRTAFRGGEYAFALPTGDYEALEDIVAWCCDIWNGGNALLVPVGGGPRSDSFVELMLSIRGVDLCVVHPHVEASEEDALRGLFGGDRVLRHFDHLIQHDLHPLNLQPSFLLPPLRQPRRPLPIPVYESEQMRRLALITWGRIDPPDEEDYDEAFELDRRDGNAAHRALIEAQVSQVSPRAQSVFHMNLIEQVSPDRARQVWVFENDAFEDLLNFWNLRSRSSSFLNPPWVGAPA